LSQKALVRLVLERANEEETLAAWLLVKAQGKGIRSPKAAPRTIERAFRLDRHLGYYDIPTYAAQAAQAVELLGAMLAARGWSTPPISASRRCVGSDPPCRALAGGLRVIASGMQRRYAPAARSTGAIAPRIPDITGIRGRR
jgi:hypothetical protein